MFTFCCDFCHFDNFFKKLVQFFCFCGGAFPDFEKKFPVLENSPNSSNFSDKTRWKCKREIKLIFNRIDYFSGYSIEHHFSIQKPRVKPSFWSYTHRTISSDKFTRIAHIRELHTSRVHPDGFHSVLSIPSSVYCTCNRIKYKISIKKRRMSSSPY